MEYNWNTWVDLETTNALETTNSIPTGDKNATNYAYWQWANSTITAPYFPSFASKTQPQFVTGYPEFNYWLNYYCSPEQEGSEGAMSQENWSQFSDVKMYRESDNSTEWAESTAVNMASLFYTPKESGVDPPASSLFNITTLKSLISLGQSTVNIISSNETVWDASTLSPDWLSLA